MKINSEFISNYFSKFKDYIEDNPDIILNEKLINNLKNEANFLFSLCSILNHDEQLMKKLNSLVKNNPKKYKIEDFIFSDLIGLYNQQLTNENIKSRFVLCFYYDALKNNYTISDQDVKTYNSLANNSPFNSKIKIKTDNIRNDNLLQFNDENPNNSFLMTALLEKQTSRTDEILKIFNHFAKLTFGLNIDSAAIKQNINQNEVKLEVKPVNNAIDNIPEDDSLEKVLAELNSLIGLKKVKDDVKELINLLEIQKRRESEGLKNIEITLHNVFLGPPGTGKTSVARLLARIYKHLGFLSKGQMYETDREGMVAGYVGQTATKVDKAVIESLGGVLFIDEAYALTQNMMGNDYGSEAINTLLKRMEDHRNDLSVVVAGYTEPMKIFIESNPGLRSRFNRYFYFDHFTPEELFKIFEGYCKNADFIMDENAKDKLSDTFTLLVEKKDDSFGNARVVRNLFEKCVQNQANRVIKIKKLTKKILKTFKEEDIPEPNVTLENVTFSTK